MFGLLVTILMDGCVMLRHCGPDMDAQSNCEGDQDTGYGAWSIACETTMTIEFVHSMVAVRMTSCCKQPVYSFAKLSCSLSINL